MSALYSILLFIFCTHIQEQSTHNDCDRVDCQSINSVRPFIFFRAFLSNEHRVLQCDDDDDNAQARA